MAQWLEYMLLLQRGLEFSSSIHMDHNHLRPQFQGICCPLLVSYSAGKTPTHRKPFEVPGKLRAWVTPTQPELTSQKDVTGYIFQLSPCGASMGKDQTLCLPSLG